MGWWGGQRGAGKRRVARLGGGLGEDSLEDTLSGVSLRVCRRPSDVLRSALFQRIGPVNEGLVGDEEVLDEKMLL